MQKNTGDVYARAKVRADEILQSIDLIQSLLNNPVETHCVGPGNFPTGARFLRGDPQRGLAG